MHAKHENLCIYADLSTKTSYIVVALIRYCGHNSNEFKYTFRHEIELKQKQNIIIKKMENERRITENEFACSIDFSMHLKSKYACNDFNESFSCAHLIYSPLSHSFSWKNVENLSHGAVFNSRIPQAHSSFNYVVTNRSSCFQCFQIRCISSNFIAKSLIGWYSVNIWFYLFNVQFFG